ncbi:CarboxypepD_reg-like domain-containing protein [Flavobacteriaceae bacterium MAR_2010_188]|nr:CarboxypepD_reg-like domain-containing protein [Flavobacteriaceae bacterium MAR_2010_188]
MKKRIDLLIYFVTASSVVAFGQELIPITGKVTANDEVEGLHVLNTASSQYTITDAKGEFIINVKLNDTLVISSVKYFTQTIAISSEILASKTVTLKLEELVNQLEEVVVGKILTGNLGLDIEINETKRDINFYDLGIPGYTGPRKTQAERRVYEATSGSGLIPLNPIINAITGRTKELKAQVALETKDRHMDLAMSKYSKLVFNDNEERPYIIEFFLFASDDENFVRRARSKNELEFLDFLMQKKNEFVSRKSETTKN